MALVLADRVKETTTTTGTGTLTLLGAVSGFQSFTAVGNGNSTYYTISSTGGSEWEVGIGTYTASGTTLSRTTILSSSNSGSAVNLSAGVKDVFVTYPAGRSVYSDGTTLTATNSAVLPIVSGGTGQTTANTAFNALAPSQATYSGKFLTTDGTNASWASAGATITNDTTTATNVYPLFASATSGTLTTAYTGNAKLLYKPSTGELQSTAMVSTSGITVNANTISADYAITSGNNGMSAGPISVASGVTVTIASGSTWVVVG